MMSRKRGRNGQGGYSLTEMLVVVAMIGLFSLVTVPQFMNYYRQAKVRASVRQFNGHMRAARLRAITRNNPTAISFAAGTVPAGGFQSGQYGIFDRNVDTSTTPPTVTWQLVGNWYRLEQPVYFLPSDFATDAATDDDLNDVVFLSNGTVSNLPVSPDTPTLELKSAANVPNNHCTITVNLAGFFTSVMSTD
jgi:prepilin-type N-terminal cleavage/methylation domain-containing protein